MAARTDKDVAGKGPVSYGVAVKQIHSGDIKPVYLLYGDEDYLQERLILAIKGAWLGDESAGFGAYVEDGRTMAQSRAVDLAGQLTLFGDRRLVVIDEPAFIPCGKGQDKGSDKDSDKGDDEDLPDVGVADDGQQKEELPGMFEDGSGGGVAAVAQRGAVGGKAGAAATARQGKGGSGKNVRGDSQPLLTYIMQPVESTCLVLRCRSGKPDRRHKLTAEILKQGGLVETTLKGPSERLPFLTEALEKSGKQCNRGILEQIARMPGGLSSSLRELDKVMAYAGDEGVITQAMLDAVLTQSIESNVFRMVDALGARRCPVALRELRALLGNGESPFAAFAMMLRQYRLIFKAKAYMQAGMRGSRLAQAMGVQPFVAEKSADQSKHYSFAELEGAMGLFCEKDLAMKSGIPPRQALEDLIIELGR
jgi:DNA polymerase-3 subunit delta